ncbi:hypothetical protein BH09BAC1_BH09BAC1_11080 [soil metagenome]
MYNANGGLIESKQQHWDDTVWLDTTRTIYTRNSYNQIELEEKAKYISGAWEDNGDTRCYYETYTITGLHEPKAAIGMNVYPNPFTINTVVDIEQPQSAEATINIYNAQGALVKQLTSYFPAGHNTWLWNGESNTGEPVSRGIYLIHVQASGKVGVHRVMKL